MMTMKFEQKALQEFRKAYPILNTSRFFKTTELSGCVKCGDYALGILTGRNEFNKPIHLIKVVDMRTHTAKPEMDKFVANKPSIQAVFQNIKTLKEKQITMACRRVTNIEAITLSIHK